MRYYQTTLLLTTTPGNLYTLHQGIEEIVRRSYLGAAAQTILRDEVDAVPQYSYRAVPRDESSLIVMIRSGQPMGLPEERERSISFAEGDQISFQYFPCVTTKRDGRSIVLPDELLPEKVIRPRLERAGLDPQKINLRGVDLLQANKPRGRPFYLAGAHVEVEATVTDPARAMAGFTHGIGHKTVFGFGLMLQVKALGREK